MADFAQIYRKKTFGFIASQNRYPRYVTGAGEEGQCLRGWLSSIFCFVLSYLQCTYVCIYIYINTYLHMYIYI